MALAFFGKLFSFLFRSNDPRVLKKRAMKQLVKELSRNRHSRFYRPKTGMAEPEMAAFFFDLYRLVSRAHVFLNNAAKSELLKELTIEAFLDIKYLDARQRLSADYVRERTKTMPLAEVARLLQEDFDLLSSGITDELMADVDRCYNQILALIGFSAFDFFFLLKKFDPGLMEDNFNLRPRFGPTPARHLRDQIKDFMDLSSALDMELDWGMPLRILKLYKNGVDVINPEEWNTLVARLRELRQSNILELMIRHIEEDPSWRFKSGAAFQHIASNYLEDRKKEVREAINGFTKDQKLLEVRELARNVFGNPDIRRAVHYTPQEGAAFVNKGLDGYICAEGFNYVKAFLLDIFKKEIQGLCELLLIRGQWYSIEFSQEMSESYHILIDAAVRINDFDDSLGETGETGSRLRNMLAKLEKDKAQLRPIRVLLRKTNEEALEFIDVSAQALIVIGTTIRKALDDRTSGAGELIINWRELESMVEIPLVKYLVATHNRISGFLQVLRLLSALESGAA
jgi:hypothetical protein